MRMQGRIPAMLLVAALGLPVAAGAPQTSLRPTARAGMAIALADISRSAVAASLRPVARPQRHHAAAIAAPRAAATQPPVRHGLFWKRKLRKTSVCGDIDLQGEVVGNIPAKLPGCGVRDAVRLRSVAGVMLSQPAVMNCQTARALAKWVNRGLQPAFRRSGPVTEMHVAAGYSCRTRNNKPGARISEHGKGKAIDLSAFTLKSGQVITVAQGWNGPRRIRKPLRKAYKAACGTFGTTLGPAANSYHRDHFHLDTASYRGGPYCQ